MYFKYNENKGMVTVVVLREEYIKEVPEVDMDAIMDKAMEEGEVETPLILIVEILAMCQDFLPNCTLSVGIATSLSMLQRTISTY